MTFGHFTTGYYRDVILSDSEESLRETLHGVYPEPRTVFTCLYPIRSPFDRLRVNGEKLSWITKPVRAEPFDLAQDRLVEA